jgi:hypothetical protein
MNELDNTDHQIIFLIVAILAVMAGWFHLTQKISLINPINNNCYVATCNDTKYISALEDTVQYLNIDVSEIKKLIGSKKEYSVAYANSLRIEIYKNVYHNNLISPTHILFNNLKNSVNSSNFKAAQSYINMFKDINDMLADKGLVNEDINTIANADIYNPSTAFLELIKEKYIDIFILKPSQH